MANNTSNLTLVNGHIADGGYIRADLKACIDGADKLLAVEAEFVPGPVSVQVENATWKTPPHTRG